MRKILAVLFTVILLFSCTSALAASDPDPDFEILTVKSRSDAQKCCNAFSENGYNTEMCLTAIGGALLNDNSIAYFDIWLIGFDTATLTKYDVAYFWDENYNKFVVATDNVIMLFPECIDRSHYLAYQLLFQMILDEYGVTYSEMSTDA